jgi:3-mercaptopyruvate sulfurtransferase SseA
LKYDNNIYNALKNLIKSTKDNWNYITPVELEKKDKKNLFLLDIRAKEDYEAGHIEGAENIFWIFSNKPG